MLERTCRRAITANWATEVVLTSSSAHNSFIVTLSRAFSFFLVVSTVNPSLISWPTTFVSLGLGPCHSSPFVQLSSQLVAKAFAARVPSRARSSGKHAARDVPLATQHERWIMGDDFSGTSRMSASYGSPPRSPEATTVSLATMVELPPQLVGTVKLYPPRSNLNSAKSFVAAYRLFIPTSNIPAPIRTTHTTPNWTSIMRAPHGYCAETARRMSPRFCKRIHTYIIRG